MSRIDHLYLPGPHIGQVRPVLALVLAVALALALAACKPPPRASGASAAMAVSVQPVAPSRIQDVLELDGVVAPVQQVNLVARVAGTLDAIRFRDGEPVKRGQVLFVIERASYLAQLRLNEARLAQARSDYDRQVQLLRENATSQASLDSALSSLQQAEANLKLAQINLDYTEVRAPFDGIMGRRQVDAGNYVGATQGGTVLATLMQISPAYVNAAVGEREALRLRERPGAAGSSARTAQSGVGKAVVRARLQSDPGAGISGVLDFVDHQVGAASGTIAIRGRFSNTGRYLVPGFYARLSIDLGETRSALVLPAAVLQSDQQGEFVYVVGADNTARRRSVRSLALPGESREIVSGLQAGERVVVSGYAKITDGQTVQAVAARPAGAAS